MPSNIDRLKNENPSQRAQDLTESISRISKQDTTETSKLDERKIPKGLQKISYGGGGEIDA